MPTTVTSVTTVTTSESVPLSCARRSSLEPPSALGHGLLPLLQAVDELRCLADIELFQRLEAELVVGFMLEIKPRPLADRAESTELGLRGRADSPTVETVV